MFSKHSKVFFFLKSFTIHPTIVACCNILIYHSGESQQKFFFMEIKNKNSTVLHATLWDRERDLITIYFIIIKITPGIDWIYFSFTAI